MTLLPYAIPLFSIVVVTGALALNAGSRRAILFSILETVIWVALIFGMMLFIDTRNSPGSLDISRLVPAFALVAGPPLGVFRWWAARRKRQRLTGPT